MHEMRQITQKNKTKQNKTKKAGEEKISAGKKKGPENLSFVYFDTIMN